VICRCKTVSTLDDHHIQYYLKNDHPVAICVCVLTLPILVLCTHRGAGHLYTCLQTDDTLPFRNSLLAEYALLLAKPPFGLGLSEDEVRKVAKGSLKGRFGLE